MNSLIEDTFVFGKTVLISGFVLSGKMILDIGTEIVFPVAGVIQNLSNITFHISDSTFGKIKPNLLISTFLFGIFGGLSVGIIVKRIV